MVSNPRFPAISGSVNLLQRPAVSVVLIDSNGQDRTIEAHLDTGFTGELTLPIGAIERLGLTLAGRSGSYRMGSGSTATFNAYGGTIRWHNQIRNIDVLETEVTPLVGIGLLWGNNVSIDFQPAGNVAITELPDC